MERKTNSQHRLESLDALRGFDMLFIMGGAALITAIASYFPENDIWQAMARQMTHAEWDGLRHHDTIFPLFLFISGVSFPFSLEKQQMRGMSHAAIIRKVLTRGFMLMALGWVCNGLLMLKFADLRFWSVLARIGMAWMLGALIYMHVHSVKRLVLIILSLLVGYSIVSSMLVAPDMPGAAALTREGNIACYIDRALFGAHCYRPDYDPEGLLSTIPAIGTALLGMISGRWIKSEREGLTGTHKATGMCLAGVLLGFVGYLWSFWTPINKALWSSSFVCVVACYSLIMLALFYYMIDVRKWRRWDFFFVVIGMNSIAIYMLPRFINFGFMRDRLLGGVVSLFPEHLLPVVEPITYITTWWIFLYIMYRYKIFLKV
ncbi:MAG: acyltransferase family protein [Bacteroidaceae bacterium]